MNQIKLVPSRPTDPVCVVSRRGADGEFREVLRYNAWIKPRVKGGPQWAPTVEDREPR